MITLTANGDVIATGDVIYKTEPVTIPQDALIPAAANMNQVLGIFTANGNFITQDAQADQNIEIDGTIATISAAESANNCASGKGGQLSYGHINTINNVGGMAQSCIYGADVNAENTWFDRRYTARPNFAPPWFPSTTITSGGALPTNTTAPRAQRVQWLSTPIPVGSRRSLTTTQQNHPARKVRMAFLCIPCGRHCPVLTSCESFKAPAESALKKAQRITAPCTHAVQASQIGRRIRHSEVKL